MPSWIPLIENYEFKNILTEVQEEEEEKQEKDWRDYAVALYLRLKKYGVPKEEVKFIVRHIIGCSFPNSEFHELLRRIDRQMVKGEGEVRLP